MGNVEGSQTLRANGLVLGDRRGPGAGASRSWSGYSSAPPDRATPLRDDNRTQTLRLHRSRQHRGAAHAGEIWLPAGGGFAQGRLPWRPVARRASTPSSMKTSQPHRVRIDQIIHPRRTTQRTWAARLMTNSSQESPARRVRIRYVARSCGVASQVPPKPRSAIVRPP